MFAVEIYAAVRRFVFVEGKSRREAARVFGLSRDTIAKMCRYSAPPGYVRSKSPERPKLGPLVPVIDAILEADKTAPPKQRHTAKRIFERLRIEHGYAGGYTVVKDYVRIARARSGEVFVPLAHPPGHAQVDFGECVGVIGGVRMNLHAFCFETPVSSRPIRRRPLKGIVTFIRFTNWQFPPRLSAPWLLARIIAASVSATVLGSPTRLNDGSGGSTARQS